jgi:hypothetical protein
MLLKLFFDEIAGFGSLASVCDSFFDFLEYVNSIFTELELPSLFSRNSFSRMLKYKKFSWKLSEGEREMFWKFSNGSYKKSSQARQD